MTRCLPAIILAGSFLLVNAAVSGQQPKPAPAPTPTIVVETVKGAFEIDTFADSPKSVEHILELVRSGFYRGHRFHIAQPGVVQFGDPLTRDMTRQDDWGTGGSGPRQSIRPIGVSEVSKRKVERGSVGLNYRMDIGRKPETADSQLFIIKIPNPALNGKVALIGRVSKGMEVVDKIERADLIRRVYVKGETPK